MRVYVQQIDETRLDGKVFDREASEELSKEGVTLVSHLDLFYYIFPKRKFIRFHFGGEVWVHELGG